MKDLKEESSTARWAFSGKGAQKGMDTSKAGRLVSMVISGSRTDKERTREEELRKVGHTLLNTVRKLLQ